MKGLLARKGPIAPQYADWERKRAAPFVKVLENKRSSKITLRLNSYEERTLLFGEFELFLNKIIKFNSFPFISPIIRPYQTGRQQYQYQ
jgi:hypothetical protein